MTAASKANKCVKASKWSRITSSMSWARSATCQSSKKKELTTGQHATPTNLSPEPNNVSTKSLHTLIPARPPSWPTLERRKSTLWTNWMVRSARATSLPRTTNHLKVISQSLRERLTGSEGENTKRAQMRVSQSFTRCTERSQWGPELLMTFRRGRCPQGTERGMWRHRIMIRYRRGNTRDMRMCSQEEEAERHWKVKMLN